MKELIVPDAIEQNIFTIRGQKVMLSMQLAELYGGRSCARPVFNQRATTRDCPYRNGITFWFLILTYIIAVQSV